MRLSRLVVGHTMALRRQLAPVEAKIHAAATQEVVDRMGLEVGQHSEPILSQLLAADPDMPGWLKSYISRTASGQHQWQAVAGQLGLSTAQGALGEVISNAIAPAVYKIVSLAPSLHVDQSMAMQALAAGILTSGDAYTVAAQMGYDQANAEVMFKLAQAIPGGPELYQLRNRGLIDDQELNDWLTRTALPPDLIGPIAALREQILAPADAALAVLRGNMSAADGYAIAAANGLSNDDFDVLIGNTGEPLALEEMLLLYRWGKMDEATVKRGILQSRVRDEWIPYALQLGIVPPSGAEIIDAVIRGQIDDQEAQQRWHVSGGDPTWYETAKTSAANPPSPTQLAEMAHRGLIPWTGVGPDVVSFQQGIYEGDTKDKWEPILRGNAVYYPPPREIATLVKEGGMTQDEAMALWAKAGLPPELAHEYWQAAHYQRTTTIHELAQGEIVKLYTDRAISRTEAMSMLESVNWTKTDANWLLDIADLSLERSLLEKAISKIGSLFIAWKIDKTSATSALAALDVPASQAELLTKTWELERGSNVKVLTAAEYTDAWYYELMSPQEAQAGLETIGYTPYDAWLLLNIKNKGPITDFPKPGS